MMEPKRFLDDGTKKPLRAAKISICLQYNNNNNTSNNNCKISYVFCNSESSVKGLQKLKLHLTK